MSSNERLPNFVSTLISSLENMAPCDVIVVEKERGITRADSDGVLLITVDFSENTTLFVYFM